jgi:hypothetical protein
VTASFALATVSNASSLVGWGAIAFFRAEDRGVARPTPFDVLAVAWIVLNASCLTLLLTRVGP